MGSRWAAPEPWRSTLDTMCPRCQRTTTSRPPPVLPHPRISGRGIGHVVQGALTVFDRKLVALQLQRPTSETTRRVLHLTEPPQAAMVCHDFKLVCLDVGAKLLYGPYDSEALPFGNAVVSLRRC